MNVSGHVDSLGSLEKRLKQQQKLREDMLDCATTDGDSTSIDIILQYTNSTILYPIFPVMSTLPKRKRNKIRALKKILHEQRKFSIFRLFKAAHDGDVEMCKLLIRYGVNVNSFFDEKSPLYAASKNGKYLCVSVLLENGAVVNAGDLANGVTPFMAAVTSIDFDPTVSYDEEFVINRLKCVGLLNSYNADVNQTDYYGNTALMHATWSYRLSEYLLTELRCLPDVMSDNGVRSALLIACRRRSPLTIELLLDAGADVDATQYGRTSLSLACYIQDRHSVELLVRYNADLHVPSYHDDNLSILQMAQSQFALHSDKIHDVWKMILEAAHINRLQNSTADWIRLAVFDRRHQNPPAAARQHNAMGTARQRRRRQL